MTKNNDLELDPADDERALRLHGESLVVDIHSDIHLDVIRCRGRGETRVLERRHFPQWKQGGINAVVLNTMAKFGPEIYPYRASPVHNYLIMIDAIHQEIRESPDCFFQILEPDEAEPRKN